MSDDKDLIELCKANDRNAQEKIFNKYSFKKLMLSGGTEAAGLVKQVVCFLHSGHEI